MENSQNSRGMRVITLGTAGGPRWWRGPAQGERVGISTAVVVDGATYLVDAGHGTGRQLMRAGCDFGALEAIFVTHLHSDHIVDLPSLLLFGSIEMTNGRSSRMPIVGPGERGKLPPLSPRATTTPTAVSPDAPTPGITTTVHRMIDAFSTDFNDRIFNALRPSPYDLYDPRDIAIPEDAGFDPNENPCPDMQPFEIYSDERVTVTAILVAHAPLAPAFAFRFDSEYGSVTISGDTGPCENMVTIADKTSLLLHEAIDFDWVHEEFSGVSGEFARASTDHHHSAHTSVEGAMDIAERAGAEKLAVHHLVPGALPTESWNRWTSSFAGEFIVPDDLQIIEVGS